MTKQMSTPTTQPPTTADTLRQIAAQAQTATQLPLLAGRAERLARRMADRINKA